MGFNDSRIGAAKISKKGTRKAAHCLCFVEIAMVI